MLVSAILSVSELIMALVGLANGPIPGKVEMIGAFPLVL